MIFLSKKWSIILLLVTLFILAPLTIANATSLTDEVTDVPVDKTWTITFNFPVIQSSITPDSIYVMNSEQEKQDITLSVNDHIVTVTAPKAGYQLGQTHTLHITGEVLGQVNNEEKALKQPITKPFTVTEGYAVGHILDNGEFSPIANYVTFDEANASLQENQGIRLKDKYVKIPAGFVATNPKAVTTSLPEANLYRKV